MEVEQARSRCSHHRSATHIIGVRRLSSPRESDATRLAVPPAVARPTAGAEVAVLRLVPPGPGAVHTSPSCPRSPTTSTPASAHTLARHARRRPPLGHVRVLGPRLERQQLADRRQHLGTHRIGTAHRRVRLVLAHPGEHARCRSERGDREDRCGMDGVSTDRPLIDARLRRRSAEQLGLLDPQTRRKQRQHLVSEFDMFAEFVDNARHRRNRCLRRRPFEPPASAVQWRGFRVGSLCGLPKGLGWPQARLI